MSQLGTGIFEFGAEDRKFQQVSDDVEKKMRAVAAELQQQAQAIDVALAKSAAGMDRLSDSVTSGMRKASADMKRDAREIQNALGKVGEGMDDVGKTARSFLNISILTRVAGGLRRMGEAAAEMSTQMRLGKADTGDLIEKVAEGIPVIGDFVKAGRGIREAITGEKSYTEVVLANAKAQDERTAAVLRFMDALKQLNRDTEDLTKRLTTKQGVGFDITGIITGGERKADDFSAEIKKRFDKQFEDIAEQRKILSQKLQNLQSQNQSQIVSAQGPGGIGGQVNEPSAALKQEIAQRQAQIKALDDQAAKLRKTIDEFEKATRETIGRGVFTEIAKRIGVEFSKGVDAASAAVQRYLANIPQISDATAKAVAALTPPLTALQKFRREMDAFRIDFSKGLIGDDMFKGLVRKATIDTGIDLIQKSIKEKISQFGPAFLQNINFAPVLNTIDAVKKTLGEMFSGRGGKGQPLPSEFRARTVSLEGLGAGIQEAAASRTQSIQDKQLKEAQNISALTTQAVAALNAIKTNTKGPTIAVAGGP